MEEETGCMIDDKANDSSSSGSISTVIEKLERTLQDAETASFGSTVAKVVTDQVNDDEDVLRLTYDSDQDFMNELNTFTEKGGQSKVNPDTLITTKESSTGGIPLVEDVVTASPKSSELLDPSVHCHSWSAVKKWGEIKSHPATPNDLMKSSGVEFFTSTPCTQNEDVSTPMTANLKGGWRRTCLSKTARFVTIEEDKEVSDIKIVVPVTETPPVKCQDERDHNLLERETGKDSETLKGGFVTIDETGTSLLDETLTSSGGGGCGIDNATRLEVRVCNGEKSIVYLTNREMTMDEEQLDEENDALPVKSDGGELKEAAIEGAEAAEGNSVKVLEGEGGEKNEGGSVHHLPPNSCHNFVSNDPQENEDNNDPEWELLRCLETDKERYKALRERWRSVIIPDPNLDLTCQNYRIRKLRVKNGVTDPPMKSENESKSDVKLPLNRKRRREPDPGQSPAAKRRKCTLFFERTVDQVAKRIEYQKYTLNDELDRKLWMLAERQERDLEAFSRSNPTAYSFQLFYSRQLEEVGSLKSSYHRMLEEAELEGLNSIRILNAAADEVHTFHKFYQDLDSDSTNRANRDSMYLTDAQLEELLETENMLQLYPQFYST